METIDCEYITKKKMKVKVYKSEEKSRYIISFACDDDPEDISGFEINCGEEELRSLYEQLEEIVKK